MGHHAFIFDWPTFERELLPAISAGLAGDLEPLRGFARDQRGLLVNPLNGEPITEQDLHSEDVDWLGEIAMTRYFDPTADHGLGTSWETLIQALDADQQQLLLGEPISVEGRSFSPGTVFQSNGRVRLAHRQLKELGLAELRGFVRTLRIAGVSQRGLMVRLTREGLGCP